MQEESRRKREDAIMLALKMQETVMMMTVRLRYLQDIGAYILSLDM
mgnify:CR=1 FL=1